MMLNFLRKQKAKEPYKVLHTDIPILDHLPILTITTTNASPTSTTPTTTTATISANSTSVQNIINLNTNKPEPFKNQDPKEWIVQYDVVSKANGWDATKKLNNIPPLFQQSKHARQWYSYTFKNQPPTDYTDFCKKLVDTLSPSNDKYVSFTRMFERKQQLAEPPIEYFFSKMDLLEKYDPQIDQQMQIDFLVDGLLPEYKRHVFGKHKTPDEVFAELRKLQTMGMNDDSVPVFMIPTSTIHTSTAPTTSTWSHNQPQTWQPQGMLNSRMMNTGPQVNTWNGWNGRNPPNYQNPQNYSNSPNYQNPQNYQNRRATSYYANNSRNYSQQQPRVQQFVPKNIYPPLPRSIKTCYCCQSPEHFIANCPVRQISPQNQDQNRNPQNYFTSSQNQHRNPRIMNENPQGQNQYPQNPEYQSSTELPSAPSKN